MNSPAFNSSAGGADGDRVRAELQRVLAGKVFSSAPTLSRFLSYLVEHRLETGETPPKEYAIAVDVFRRSTDFDPQVDTIVRVQARRLRKRLSRYYEEEGRAAPLCFTIPKGHYQVEITEQAGVPASPEVPSGEFEPLGPKSGTGAEPGRRREAPPSRAWRVGGVAIGVAVLIALIAVGVYARFGRDPGASGKAVAPFHPPANSMVVLPFTNLNGEPKQQYFSDGITEELTNALGQNTKLTVIAWDTASRYRNSRESPHAIGAALDVATLLHGSIEREGDTIRVMAELVDTRTGKQLWSAHYDDSAANVFAVQDKISQAIAGALNVKFASLGPAPAVNPRAHDLVLKARALTETAAAAAPIEQASALLEQAIALDPNYADAHAYLADAWLGLTQVSTMPLKDTLPKVRAEANEALALDSRNEAALVALGSADLMVGKRAQAKAEYRRALAIDPSDAAAHVSFGGVLPPQQFLAQEQEAAQLDPQNAAAQDNLAVADLDSGKYAQALQPSSALMKLAPHSADNAMMLALVYSLLHRLEDAVKVFDLAKPDTPLAKALVAAGRLTYQSELDPKLHARGLAAVDALRRRSDLAPSSMVDVFQLDLALGQDDTALESLARTCAAMPVYCGDLSVDPLYLPLRGQPAFQTLVEKYDTISGPPSSGVRSASSSH